jgi:hypothetical protein
MARKSLGGVRTDLRCQVLTADNAPVPGLFAAGELCGLAGGHLTGKCALEGMMLGGSLFSGRVAGAWAAHAVGRAEPAHLDARQPIAPAGAAPTAEAAQSIHGSLVLWLEGTHHALALPAPQPRLLAVLDAHGIPYAFRARAWADPALGAEPLLEAVGGLGAPLEIVHNGQLAAVGVAHLRVRAGDTVVIGGPACLRQHFPVFH